MTVDVDAAADPPVASDGTVTTDEDTAYTFRADEFGFTDVDGAGGSLASVKIVTAPSMGTLTLDGTAVAANQSVTRARIDAGGLVFTAVENANGDGYARFTFKVSDGTEESPSTYTMTIDVTPVNDPATGRPSISGREEVDHTLSADTSGLADIDGLPDSLVYRWVRIDGATETTIAGASANTYRLVEADLGKTLKVEVSFTDRDGTAESATSDATGTVGANASPKAADATVTVNEDTTYTFRAGDFNFSSTAGRTLASVRIVTLPSVGLLLFHGEPVTEGQSVTKADIDITKLYFNPVAGANGAAHARFTFKVSDGTEETAAYTMTIDVTPENDPATGTPTVTGKVQVGHTLVADIADYRRCGRSAGAVRLSMETRRRHDRDGYLGGQLTSLYADLDRRGQEAQGDGELHRRGGCGGERDEWGDGGGGNGDGGHLQRALLHQPAGDMDRHGHGGGLFWLCAGLLGPS